jgi:hypothetical protein
MPVPPVVGGRPTETDEEFGRAPIHGALDELSDAERAGVPNVSLVGNDKTQARGGGLDHCQPALWDVTEARRGGAAERIMGLDRDEAPSSASTTASTVPSPPSAIGTPTHSALGITETTPLRIAACAWEAVIDSLNESGRENGFTV